MEKANFGQIVSFLFGIANDCLVDTYDVGDYRKIILPMMVIRRFDAVLEPTKEKVLKMKEQLVLRRRSAGESQVASEHRNWL